MSVQILDLKLYQKVYVTICRHFYRNDELRRLTFSEGQLRTMMKFLAEMNYVSYCTRYPLQCSVKWEGIYFVRDCIGKWNYNTLNVEPCSDVQLCKYLQCIAYQIEIDHMKYKKTCKIEYESVWRWLTDAENVILRHLVQSTSEYQEAKWSLV